MIRGRIEKKMLKMQKAAMRIKTLFILLKLAEKISSPKNRE